MIRLVAVFTLLLIARVGSYVVLNPGSYSPVVVGVAMLAVAPGGFWQG